MRRRRHAWAAPLLAFALLSGASAAGAELTQVLDAKTLLPKDAERPRATFAAPDIARHEWRVGKEPRAELLLLGTDFTVKRTFDNVGVYILRLDGDADEKGTRPSGTGRLDSRRSMP